MKRRLLPYLCLVGGASAAAFMACSNGTSGTGPEQIDGSIDATPEDVVSDSTRDVNDTGAHPLDGGDAAMHHEGGPDDAGADAFDSGADVQDSSSYVLDSSLDATEAGDADGGTDGAADASCTGVFCNGQCLAATDCRSCAGAALLCGPTRTCTTNCRSCSDTSDAGLPIQCFACDNNHQSPIGSCQYFDSGSYCLSGNYLGKYDGGPGYRCSCTSVSDCPGASQVCVPLGSLGASFCLTCGETTLATIQGSPCQGGGACQATSAACQ
jgi:hypothetical protein